MIWTVTCKKCLHVELTQPRTRIKAKAKTVSSRLRDPASGRGGEFTQPNLVNYVHAF